MEEKLVLCDTNILIEFYKATPAVLSTLKRIGQDNIAISSIVSAELFYGALNRQELNKIRKDVEHLRVLHLDEAISEQFHELMLTYSMSHHIGIPDALIASTAIVHQIELYTLNTKDFRYIKGLELYKA